MIKEKKIPESNQQWFDASMNLHTALLSNVIALKAPH